MLIFLILSAKQVVAQNPDAEQKTVLENERNYEEHRQVRTLCKPLETEYDL